MKTILICILSLVYGFSQAEESQFVEAVRKGMKYHGWNTKDISFQEIEEYGQLIFIKRSGKIVGYYYVESVWEKRDVETIALNGVTRIVYGYGHPEAPNLFQINDQDEIAIWIAAYKNHTEFERRFGCFVPTIKSAGFEQKRDEHKFGGGCMCSLALRFYAGDTEVLELKGHVAKYPEIDSGMRNHMLHALAKSKVTKKAVKYSPTKSDLMDDPFGPGKADK